MTIQSLNYKKGDMQMLKKLSLAALVAMGSMSFAGATDLSSAIQGVQLNGYLRVRAYVDKNSKKQDYLRWRTNAKLVFGVPVADNTKIVWRVNAQQNFKTTNKAVVGGSRSDLGQSLFFLNYKKDAIAANVGIVPLGFLPYASSDSWGTAHGAGADATYTLNDNLTLAAGYVDQIWNAKKVSSQDIYTLGAIYKDKNLGTAQAWYATVVDTLKYDVMLMTNLNILKDQGIGVNIDIAQSKYDDAVVKNADSHNFFNISFTGKVSGADVKVGYAATNDKAGVINTHDDSKIGQTTGALRYNVANLTDATAVYAKAGYKLDKATKVFVAYDNISADEGDSNEYEVGAKHKVTKKFGISGYVDYLDNDGSAANDTTEARVEFKYSF
jgi:hypothetical protein